jgi:hypothetical protein
LSLLNGRLALLNRWLGFLGEIENTRRGLERTTGSTISYGVRMSEKDCFSEPYLRRF